MKTLSVDLRQRILNSYDEGLGNRQEIADRYRVSLGMVKKLLVQRKEPATSPHAIALPVVNRSLPRPIDAN